MNQRPPGYEPDELPTALLRDIEFSMVPVTGVEPVRRFHRGILSPLRLPIPPHRLIRCLNIILYNHTFVKHKFSTCSAKIYGASNLLRLHILIYQLKGGLSVPEKNTPMGDIDDLIYGNEPAPVSSR